MPAPNRAARRRAIGRAICDRRRVLGHPQHWLADELFERTGVERAVATISNWERGTRVIPAELLPVIADALQCNIADLFQENGE